MQTDNQLIRKIKQKQNRKAADELLGRYYKEIYAYTYRQIGEREQAMDLTQDIFVAVIRGIVTFDEKKAQFRTWLYRVASNKIKDYYRSLNYKMRFLQEEILPETEDLILGQDDMQIERIFQKESIRQVMEIVTRYNAQWIDIFQKKCFEEKTFSEIAEELNISENTAKTRFYSIIKRLKKEVIDNE